MGKIIRNGQVRPIEAKIEAICVFPIPTNCRELHRFLGMAGYYRGFCPSFSSVVAPLTDLISPKIPFEWTTASQEAFEGAKALLANAPVLIAANFSRPFCLAVDVSETGAGAVLLQKTQDGIEHPICYFSRKCNVHQRVYSVVEKEALALVLAVQQVYLGASASPIIVYTDHNPLMFLHRMKNRNQRIMRWSLILQPFLLEIKHVRGTENVIADALSRA